MNLKPGDKVTPVDTSGELGKKLIPGETYTVVLSREDQNDKANSTVLLKGFNKEMFAKRFKLVDASKTSDLPLNTDDTPVLRHWPSGEEVKEGSNPKEVFYSKAANFVAIQNPPPNYDEGGTELVDQPTAQPEQHDVVNQPKHYTKHPSGVECIQITEHYNFCIGNAIKYLWRSDLKNGIEDLKKAIWYINREIENRTKNG